MLKGETVERCEDHSRDRFVVDAKGCERLGDCRDVVVVALADVLPEVGSTEGAEKKLELEHRLFRAVVERTRDVRSEVVEARRRCEVGRLEGVLDGPLQRLVDHRLSGLEVV